MPLSRVFKKFKIIQTKVKIGFSTFKRLRPKSVMQSRRWHSCRCTYCVNAELVMAAINRKLVGKNSTLKIVSVYDLVCKVFCDKPLEANYQRMECIKQECEFCDDWAATLHSHYEPVCNDRATCAMVMKWHRWELKEVEVNARKGGVFVREKRKKRVLVDHRGTIKEAIQSLIKDLEEPCQGTTLPMHLFVGN